MRTQTITLWYWHEQRLILFFLLGPLLELSCRASISVRVLGNRIKILSKARAAVGNADGLRP